NGHDTRFQKLWSGRNLPINLLVVYPPATAGGTDCLGPGTRDPTWALSTLDRAHRGYGFLFVGGDDRDVSFLDGAEGSVGIVWIGFVPVKAGEVLLRPGVLENFSVAGINLIVHLANVFKE